MYKTGKKSSITTYQLSLLLILFVFGDTFIIYNASNDPQHGWASNLLAGVGGYILLMLYLQLYKMNCMQSLTVTLKNCLGKYLGTFVSFLYVLFFINTTSLILFNYSNYLVFTNYYDTPKLFIILVLCTIVTYALFKGIRVIARSAELLAWVIFVSVLVATAISLRFAKLENIFPIGYWDIKAIFQDFFQIFTKNYAQIVVFLVIFPLAGNMKEIKKPLFIGLSVILGIISLIYLRTILILGGGMISRYVYAFHLPLFSIVKAGIFFSSVMGISVLIKLMILLYASISILRDVFNTRKYGIFIIPIVLLVVIGSIYMFKGVLELVFYMHNILPYYAVVFEAGIPLVLYVISLVKYVRNIRKKNIKST